MFFLSQRISVAKRYHVVVFLILENANYETVFLLYLREYQLSRFITKRYHVFILSILRGYQIRYGIMFLFYFREYHLRNFYIQWISQLTKVCSTAKRSW